MVKGIRVWRRRPSGTLLLSGGQGKPGERSEASVMRDFALAQGVPVDHVMAEQRSRNTIENLKYSASLLPEGGRMVVVTSWYHVPRALAFARRQGLDCVGVGAPTRWYYAVNALVREFAAYLYYSRWRVFGAWVVFTLSYVAAALARGL